MGLRWRLCAGTKCQILTTSWWLGLDQSGASINLYPNGDRMLAMGIFAAQLKEPLNGFDWKSSRAAASSLFEMENQWETKVTNWRALDHDHIA